MPSGETISLIGLAVGLVATMVGVWLQYRHLRNYTAIMLTQINSEYEWRKRNASLEFAIGRNTSLREARAFLDQKLGRGSTFAARGRIPIEEIQQTIADDASVYVQILSLLGNLENMALAIYADIADEEVAFETNARTTLQVVEVFGAFIDDRRRTNPRAYDYLLELTTRWRERLSTHPRPLFARLGRVDAASNTQSRSLT